MSDQDAMKAYREAGVDLPELDAPTPALEPKDPEPEPKEEPAKEPKADPEPLKETPPKEPRKRSIYDDLKDERKDRKDAETRADQAEQERDELQRKLEEATAAKPGDDRTDAEEDALAYAKKIGADPDLVKRIIEDARKGMKPELDEDTKRDLQEFKTWKSQNAQTLEKQQFDAEFAKTVPFIKSTFPTASDAELATIKGKLDAISHTKDWHDKDLEYIAYKHKDELSALVSPKKRGMESKGRQDVDDSSPEFDPNADYASMSPKQREAWEATYRGKRNEGLATDAQGRKIII